MRAGFTLIQLSVLLAVAGMVLAATLPGRDAGDTNEKIIRTLEIMDKIEAASQAFMAANGYRPCPADGQYDINHQYFGREAGYASPSSSPGSCVGGLPAAPMGPDIGTGTIYMGTVPTKSLDIPDDYAFDAWGRQISYVVDGRATSNALCYDMVNTNTQGNITIQWKNYTGAVIDSEETMYALISHGPDGHGAWPPQGSTVAGRINRNNTDADTLVNAGVNAAFTYNTTLFTSTKIKRETTPGFDDLVYYRPGSRNQCCIGAACQLFNPKAFNVEGENSNDGAGSHCGTFDVNADGMDDLVITSPHATADGIPNAGKVYIKFGTTSPITSAVDVTGLNGVNGFTIKGHSVGMRLGTTVDTGDFNGDGIDDLIMLAPGAESFRGYAAILLGASGAYPSSSTTNQFTATTGPNGQKGFIIAGAATDTAARLSTAKFGDFNGDHYDDVIIGDPAANGNNGNSYIVYGTSTAITGTSTPIYLSDLAPPANTAVLVGNSGGGRFGQAAVKCDVNGDGVDDIIVSAPMRDIGGYVEAGEVNVVLGKKNVKFTGTQTAISLLNGTTGYANRGVNTGDHTGMSLACGDINGDGLQDINMGAPDADSNGTDSGAVFIEYGQEAIASPTKSLNSLRAAFTGFRLDGKANSRSGHALQAADINGDGVDDVITGAPDMDVGVLPQAGGAYVSFGNRYEYLSINDLEARSDGEHGIKIEGAVANERAGLSVCTTNVNATRVRGIVIGAPEATASALSNAGRVYNIRGRHNWANTYKLKVMP